MPDGCTQPYSALLSFTQLYLAVLSRTQTLQIRTAVRQLSVDITTQGSCVAPFVFSELYTVQPYIQEALRTQQDNAMHCESDTVCTVLLQCVADLWRSPRQKAGVDTITYTGLGTGVGVGTEVRE